MINEIDIVKDCYWIMVTKYPKDNEDYDEEYLKHKLMPDNIIDSPNISEKAKCLLKIGVSKLFIFYKPKKGEKLKDDKLLGKVVNGMNFL